MWSPHRGPLAPGGLVSLDLHPDYVRAATKDYDRRDPGAIDTLIAVAAIMLTGCANPEGTFTGDQVVHKIVTDLDPEGPPDLLEGSVRARLAVVDFLDRHPGGLYSLR